MLTSRGQGYIVESAENLMPILKEIKAKIENGTDIRSVLASVDLDSISKEILFEIIGGK